MEGWSAWRLFQAQLRGSGLFIFFTALLLVLLLLYGTRGWVEGWVLAVAAGLEGSVILLALVTGIHEALHLERAHRLGIEVSEVRVLGLGNIRYRVVAGCPGKALVAEEPYRRPHQYILLLSWALSYSIPLVVDSSIARMVFAFMVLLPLAMLLASVCTVRAMRSIHEGSPCYRMASVLGSRGDLEDVEECRT